MNRFVKSLSATALSLSALTAFAAGPLHLITHNDTSEESNAFISEVPSLYPTPAHSTKRVYWNAVKLACYGHTTAGKCSALIRMATNTSNPIDVGVVTLDLDTGDINPKFLSNNGYTVTINAPGEATISPLSKSTG